MESNSQSPVKKQGVLEGEAKGMERVNGWRVPRTVWGLESVSHSSAQDSGGRGECAVSSHSGAGLPSSALLEASGVQVRVNVLEG